MENKPCPECKETFGHLEGCLEALRRATVAAIAQGGHSGDTITELMQMVERSEGGQ